MLILFDIGFLHHSSPSARWLISNYSTTKRAWNYLLVTSLIGLLIKEIFIFFSQILFCRFYIKFNTQTRSVPNFDKSVFNNRIRETLYYIIPPFQGRSRVFKSNVVLRHSSPNLNMCCEADQSVENAMRSNLDTMQVSIFSYPFHFSNTANIFRVGTKDPYRMFFYELAAVFPQVKLFTGMNRGCCTPRKFNIVISKYIWCIVTSKHILTPHQVK